MLLKCPECELPLSDKATMCPHCGYVTRKRNAKHSMKRRRLPNGFGQISEIKNDRLRKRFRAMVTVGKTEEGKPICKMLKPNGFFETYNQAYEALVEYNKNPYDLNPAISVKELYDKWTNSYFKTLKSSSSTRTITSAWAYCSELYNMRAIDLRARHIKGCINNGFISTNNEVRKASPSTKSRIKSLFNLMLDYALEYELVDKNYARTFNISDDIIKQQAETKRGHIPFSESEMNMLWSSLETIPYVDVLLIQCYSGWRPQELGLIQLENVDLDSGYFVGGMKTDAGYNRKVPIHPNILKLVQARYNDSQRLGSKYLINCTDGKTRVGYSVFTYDKYKVRFSNIVSALDLNEEHRPHDGRMQFVTMAKKHDVDEYAIKYMVGHKIYDLTEKTYTKREFSWLQTEIAKIK